MPWPSGKGAATVFSLSTLLFLHSATCRGRVGRVPQQSSLSALFSFSTRPHAVAEWEGCRNSLLSQHSSLSPLGHGMWPSGKGAATVFSLSTLLFLHSATACGRV